MPAGGCDVRRPRRPSAAPDQVRPRGAPLVRGPLPPLDGRRAARDFRARIRGGVPVRRRREPAGGDRPAVRPLDERRLGGADGRDAGRLDRLERGPLGPAPAVRAPERRPHRVGGADDAALGEPVVDRLQLRRPEPDVSGALSAHDVRGQRCGAAGPDPPRAEEVQPKLRDAPRAHHAVLLHALRAARAPGGRPGEHRRDGGDELRAGAVLRAGVRRPAAARRVAARRLGPRGAPLLVGHRQRGRDASGPDPAARRRLPPAAGHRGRGPAAEEQHFRDKVAAVHHLALEHPGRFIRPALSFFYSADCRRSTRRNTAGGRRCRLRSG